LKSNFSSQITFFEAEDSSYFESIQICSCVLLGHEGVNVGRWEKAFIILALFIEQTLPTNPLKQIEICVGAACNLEIRRNIFIFDKNRGKEMQKYSTFTNQICIF
jgi:hypothetical protein